MIREKLNKIPITTLGAINGILFGVVSDAIWRIVLLIEIYLRKRNPSPSNVAISYPIYPFSWWFLPLLFFISATIATFIVQRYAATYIKFSIWFWQIVGVVTLLILASFSIDYDFYNWYLGEFEFTRLSFLLFKLKRVFFIFFILFPIIAVFNLLFALVLKRLKTRLP